MNFSTSSAKNLKKFSETCSLSEKGDSHNKHHRCTACNHKKYPDYIRAWRKPKEQKS